MCLCNLPYLSCSRLEDICNLLGKDWVALAYELGVSVATVNQIQAKRITAAEQAQLMLKLWKTQSGTKAQGRSSKIRRAKQKRVRYLLG